MLCFGSSKVIENIPTRQPLLKPFAKDDLKNIFDVTKENSERIDVLIVKLQKEMDYRISSIVNFLIKTSSESDLKVILAKAEVNSDISSVTKTKFGKLNGLYVDEGAKIRIYLSNDLKKNGNLRNSKTLRVLLHEISHHVVNKLNIHNDKKMVLAANKTILNTYMSLWATLPFKSEKVKANHYIIKNIIGKRLFESKDNRAEEILCDAFKIIHYSLRHPQRAEQVEKIFRPMLEYIDNVVITGINGK